MSYTEDAYRQMVSSFRTTDLQNLLGAFGRNKTGRKAELKNRVLDLIQNRQLNSQGFLTKLSEIYHSIQNVSNTNSIQRANMMNMNVQNNQQRFFLPPPQYNQQPLQLVRAGLPQIMPQIQRGMHGNPSYPYSFQSTGPRRIVIQVPANQTIDLTAPNPMGLNPGNNNAVPIPPAPALTNVTFKKLPFFEYIGEIIKPITLVGHDRCSLQNKPRGMKEAAFKFVLTPEHATLIGMNRDLSNPQKPEYIYIVQIRICLYEPGASELTDFLPLGLHIRVGNKVCQLPPCVPNVRPGTEARRTARPIGITHGLKLNPSISNIIIVNWNPDGKNYVLGVSLVKKLSSEILLQRLEDKGTRSSKETKDYIIKKLADVDPDVATTSYRFSLLCPLGKMRMEIPAKSVNCDHLQCFDARVYILMNEKKPTWLCPTCNKSCVYDDIQIENYFLEVVTSPNLSENSREIEILADGTWRVFEESIDTEISPAVKETPIVLITLDDSDEETVELNKELKPESSKDPGNLKSSFIDLTLDDEKLPTEKEKQENEAQAADAAQPLAVVDLKPQAQVQPQQAVTSSEQGVVIEIDSPTPPTSPTPTSNS